MFNPKFRFLGFALGRNGKGTYIRVHAKSKKKAKDKLRKLTSRSQGRKLDTVLYNIKVLYERMAELLRCSENQKPNERMERMVAAKNTNVYLETVEEAENKGNKLKEVRNAQMEGVSKRQHPKRILGYCRKWYIDTYHNK